MTETEQRDNTHGDPNVKPRFGPDSPDFTPSGNPSDPRGPDTTAAGKASDPRSEDSIQAREAAGGIGSRGAVGGAESGLADQLGKGFTGAVGAAASAAGGGGALGALRQVASVLTRNKKKSAAGGAVSVIVGILIFISGIASGPFELIHFGQLLQQFHFTSNEDFGDDRAFRNMVYGLTGRAVRTRLGVVGNYAADKWEAKLAKDAGFKPVYTKGTGRLGGWALVDESKSINKLLDVPEGSKTSDGLERAMGKGAEITTAGEVRGQDLVDSKGNPLSAKTKVLDTSGLSARERRKMVSTIHTMAESNRITSALASRLLKKRGGVDFHPFRNLVYKGIDKLVDWRFERRKKAAEEARTGAKEGKVGAKNSQDTDDDKKPDTPSEADKAAAEGADKIAEEAAKEISKSSLKKLVARMGGGAAAVGVLCAARGFGDAVPDYKYANNVLPMMRMGMNTIAMGEQIKSGQGVTLDEVGAMKDALYDPATKSSWTQASTIQGELGNKGTGRPMPPEARLDNVNDKPYFFDVLDSIPFLGTACTISGIPGDIPLVGDVLDLSSEAVISGVNVAAGAFGTSVDEIMLSALALVSGHSVDTMASGADYGNLANTGSFLAANDNAVTMGGAPLTNAERAQLRFYENSRLIEENGTKSFAERYLDPYNYDSLSGQLIDKTPKSVSAVANILTSSISMFTGAFIKLLPFGSSEQVNAASGDVNYGVPKFGFSIADQDNPQFENPYDNAAKVEPKLDVLNDKYGKPCFGMTVTVNSGGINIDTEAMGSGDLNVFKVMDKKECNPQKNHDPWFKRYRFYLADAVSTASNACWQANGDPKGEKYCQMLGLGTDAAISGSPTGGVINGDAQELAQQLLDNPNVSYPYADAVDGTTVKDVLKSIVRTGEGIVNSPDVNFKSVPVSTDLLKALVEYAENYPIALNALTNADHSSTSNHYKGIAIDIGCSPELNVTAFNKIASKYGGHNNGETCPAGNEHYHYDF